MSNKKEVFWYKDPSQFITKENYYKIIPHGESAFIDQLNAISRFALYYCIVVALLKQSTSPMIFLVVFYAFMFIIYNHHIAQSQNEKFVFDHLSLKREQPKGDICYKPTKENPFMNVTYGDRKDFQNRPRACNVTLPTTKKAVKQLYEKACYYDDDDIFRRNDGSRQFYTTSITTIPNDQEAFANWLYKVPGKTCKEGNGYQCTPLFRKHSI